MAWLERHLQQYKGTVIAVTHDRYFLDNVAGWILELDRGYGIPWKGNYSSWLEQKKERLSQEEKTREQAPEDAGARAGVDPACRPRRARPRARRASTAYESLLSQETEQRREELEIYIPPGPRLGDIVIELDKVYQGLRRPAAVRRPER